MHSFDDCGPFGCNFIHVLPANYPSLCHGLANFQDRRSWPYLYIHALIDGSNWPTSVQKSFILCLFIFHSLGPLQIVWFSSTPDFITEGKRMGLECYFSGWPFPQEVHWFKDDKIITNGAKGIYHSEDRRLKNGKETLHTRLSLLSGREELEGIYKCSGKNEISEVSEYLQLIYVCK